MHNRSLRFVALALLVTAGLTSACRTMQANTGPREDSQRTAFSDTGDNTAKTGALVVGGLLAAAGPAVVIGGIALDKQPSTPPVEAFAAGAGLTVLGVATIIVAEAVL